MALLFFVFSLKNDSIHSKASSITILSIVTYGWFLRVAKIDDIDVALDCHYDFHTLNFLNETFFKWRAAFKMSDSRVSSPSE